MSLLIERFVASQDGSRPAVAEHEIVKCIGALRRRVGLRAEATSSLEPFLARRNITDVAIDDELKADGALVPLGVDFRAGFRMVLRRNLPEGRINFTVAHEICHTFFYERVPEIKFAPHMVDQEEERLCNCGAEEILMPALDVRRCAKSSSVSLDALQMMAARYRVSMPAMLIRHRKLGLWRATLVLWHRMTNDQFAIKRVWGGRGKSLDWRWMDDEIPRRALSAPAEFILSGGTFWLAETPEGRRSLAVTYQLKRHGNGVLAFLLHNDKRSPKHSRKKSEAARKGVTVIPRQSDLFS